MLTAARQRESSEVLAALWRGRWLVLVAALVAGTCGYLVSGLQAPSYTTESRLVLRAVEDFDPLGRQSYTDSTRFVANQVSIVDSGPVLDAAVRDLDDGTDRTELAEAIDVSASADAAVVVVEATGPTAESAAERADAVVEGYRDYVRQRIAARAREATAATSDPVIIDQVTTQAAAYGDGLAVVDSAEVPTEPSSPVPARDGLLLAAVAALLAGGFALLRRSSGAPAGAPEVHGVRTLGSVAVPKDGRAAPDPEAYAVPLVALGYVADLTTGAVLVTGLSERSGAADVAHGLATAAAAQGRRVLVVDARPDGRPVLGRTGSPTPRRSLIELGSGASEADVLVAVPLSDGGGGMHLAVVGSESGAPMPSGAAVASVLGRLRASHDLVLLATAPVVDSALAFSLLGHASAVVVAMGAREGTERLPEVQQRLELAQVPLVGTVTTVPTRANTHRVPTRTNTSGPPRTPEQTQEVQAVPAPPVDERAAAPRRQPITKR